MKLRAWPAPAGAPRVVSGKKGSTGTPKPPGGSGARIAARRVLLSLLCWPGVALQAATAPTYDDVAPILAARCVMCHSGPSAPRGLRLDNYDAIVKGGERGPVVRSGDAAGSELIRRLTGASQPRMPMTGPPFLTDQEIATFDQWIAAGLKPGTTTQPAQPVASRPGPGEPVTFSHVAPIFATRCAKCHTDTGLMGPAPEGYRLTSHESTLSAADRVRVVPGNPAASELLRRIKGQAQPRMPFDGPPFLSPDEISLIEAWIAGGARSPSGEKAPVPTGARLRLHGVLGPGWRLDDLPLTVGSGTRIDKRPQPGDHVQIRGSLGANGDVIAERIRRR